MIFSMNVEVASALIIILLMYYNREAMKTRELRSRWFNFCLSFSLISVGIDILSTGGIYWYDMIPHWLNMLLASLYFLLTSFTCSIIALFVLYLIYEHSDNMRYMRSLLWLNIGMMIFISFMLILNVFDGCLFYFSEGIYYHGTLNWVGYIMLILDFILIFLCFFQNRSIVTTSLVRVIMTLPWIVVIAIVFQLLHPEIMINGMLFAIANLLIFISFQNSLIGVDALTGLGDRSAFMERLNKFTYTKKRFHVVLISIRKFDQVNMNFGNLVGDEFLYAIARFLDSLPSCSMAYRLGSVNFALICPESNCKKIGRCIELIQNRFKSPWISAKHECLLSACYSDLLWEGQAWNGSQILERLEYTMMLAKKCGENTHLNFDEKINRMMERQNYVIEQMRIATAEKSFEIYYQPVYNCQEEQFTSAEALVRLFDKDGTLILPAEFIPIAEESMMIGDISWIIIEKVCAFIAAHPDLPLQAISINLSAQQFMEVDMEEHLDAIIERYGISHHRIKIEITERVICEDLAKTQNIMTSLSEKGIGFYLDDFGTAYSNIASVLSLPFETIKLDKSLMDKLSGTPKDYQFLDALIQMFRNAGYTLVAEGAEQATTVDALRQMGVEQIQSFYYARPMPGQNLIRFLEDHHKESL